MSSTTGNILSVLGFGSSAPGEGGQEEDKLINGKSLSQRLKQKNFGFGERITVSKILIHPIKSCRGIAVQSVLCTPKGLENDRKFCILDAETNVVITAREVGKVRIPPLKIRYFSVSRVCLSMTPCMQMILITPSIESDQLRVTFPADSECESFCVPLQPDEKVLETGTDRRLDSIKLHDSVVDGRICGSVSGDPSPSEILSKYFEKPVHLVYKGPRPRNCDPTTSFPQLGATTDYPDGYPLLVLSEESVEAVERELRGHVGKQGVDERWSTDRLVIERFRPNIIFSGGEAFAEDRWEEIQIGSAPNPILVVSKCARCLLPNVSPETGIRDKAVPYKIMMKCRTGVDPLAKMKPCLGCNGVPLGNQVIRVGDEVVVRKIEMI